MNKVNIKTKHQIQLIKEGGKILSDALDVILKTAKPGVNLLEIEKKAVQLIRKGGAEPGFMRVSGYDWATCLNVNEGIVHGVPKDYSLKEGDVLSVDIGAFYKGFNTDMCRTVLVGRSKQKKKIEKFLNTGKKALQKAVKQVYPGGRLGKISQQIQKTIEKQGYNCARNLTGHGIGKKLHEPPAIPCILRGEIKNTLLLKTGMVIAVEVIYMMGKADLIVADDHWTMETEDNSLSAVFEKTVAVVKNGCQVLTPF